MKVFYERRSSPFSFPATLSILGIVFFVAILCLLVRSSGVGNVTIGKKSNISKTTLLKNYTVHYPIFHDAALDAIISKYTDNQINAFEKKLAGKNDIRDHLTITFSVAYIGTQTASIEFTQQEQVIGQPDISTKHRLTLDLIAKKELTVQDVILQTLEARQALAKLLHDFFKENATTAFSPTELVDLLELQLDDLYDFSIEPNALVLSLNPHHPSNKTTGLMSIAINKDLLGNVLRDNYKKPDTGAQAAVTDYRIERQPRPGTIIDPGTKMIALTFDDGPSPLTTRLLDTLSTYEANATFFVIGRQVAPYSGLLQRELREGNEIGNHSWDHPDLRAFTGAGLDHEIIDTQHAIQLATGGYTPSLMRPPYGGTNPAVLEYLSGHQLTQVLWNVDTNDWRDHNAETVYGRIMAGAGDGRVVLLHDIYPTSIQAATRAIRDLKAEGYQLVTISDLYKYHHN